MGLVRASLGVTTVKGISRGTSQLPVEVALHFDPYFTSPSTGRFGTSRDDRHFGDWAFAKFQCTLADLDAGQGAE